MGVSRVSRSVRDRLSHRRQKAAISIPMRSYIPKRCRVAASSRGGVEPKAWVHAKAVGGTWEWRMRPWVLVAVVVQLGWQVIFQPQR